MDNKSEQRVIIVMKGGIVDEVYADGPVDYLVIDFDGQDGIAVEPIYEAKVLTPLTLTALGEHGEKELLQEVLAGKHDDRDWK